MSELQKNTNINFERKYIAYQEYETAQTGSPQPNISTTWYSQRRKFRNMLNGYDSTK